MTIIYLLPCSCGRKIPVEPRQAGEEILCRCGASLEVPTMLSMAELPRAEPEPASQRPPASWGVGQSSVLLGVVVTLASLVLATLVLWSRPTPPPPDPTAEEIRRWTQATFSPLRSWRVWRSLRANGLDRTRLPDDVAYEEELLRWWSWLAVVLIVAVGGISAIITPLLMKRRTAARNYSRDA